MGKSLHNQQPNWPVCSRPARALIAGMSQGLHRKHRRSLRWEGAMHATYENRMESFQLGLHQLNYSGLRDWTRVPD